MPFVTDVFKPVPVAGPGPARVPTGPVLPVDTTRQLHSELAAVGMPVAGVEAGATPQFGPATSAQLKQFQQRYGLPADEVLDPTTGGVLALVAMVATETDRAKLRTELRRAKGQVAHSPQFNYWLARSAILAGDYNLAANVNPHLPDLSGNKVNIDDLVVVDGGGQPPRAPEVPFPENFYSYRNDLISQALITALRMGRTQPTTGVQSVEKSLADSAEAWLDAVEAWQLGNAEFAKQRYDSAAAAYDHCQQATLNYFSIFPDYKFVFTTDTLATRVDGLICRLVFEKQNLPGIWAQINGRRQLLALADLSEVDWTPITPEHIIYQLLQGNLAGSPQPPPPTHAIGPQVRQQLMDARLLVMVGVLVPMARGEANRLRRQYAEARADFSRALRDAIPLPDSPTLFVPAPLKCDFIEVPFLRLLLVETMLDQAEAQFKARLTVDEEPDPNTRTAQLTQLAALAQDFTNRHIVGEVGNTTRPFNHLVAALTYGSVVNAHADDGEYVARTKKALDTLHTNVASTVADGDVSSLTFRSLGKTITLPTVASIDGTLPGVTSSTHPHEPYLQFLVPDGAAMRERNPRVYGLLLQAQSRLLQIWSGFNYLGYRDDYVPPWRFQYMLDRARYFSEHAKNAQRDYLNFLGNAENEEFKEMSAAQNVELEKANVQIETARVDQSQKEVGAAKSSSTLAQTHAQNAQQAFNEYVDFQAKSNEATVYSRINSFFDEGFNIGSDVLTNNYLGLAKDGLNLWDSLTAGQARYEATLMQGNLEKHNLQRAAQEAAIAKQEADAKLETAKAGLVVAGLQRQAALLRHEFALQNLQFMRNRTLNTEQWYRLAAAIRSIGDTYLRYAIETAFLAQQSYNFETDRRLNIIRFDYDLSNVGAMLAADFLLRDLDTLEQDLIVSQQTRLQQARYVLSLAREFPETLRTLAETGGVMFSMRLEQLERHFPGLLNLRISNVDLQPIALMDPTRISVELTHLGTGMVRLRAQPGTSPLNTTDLQNGDWLTNAEREWPVKIKVSGPDTALFTGLSRQEVSSIGMIAANERGAFEGLPGASNWQIDMSMKENQVVPGTLVDVLIVFVLSGYYDPQLRNAIDHAQVRSLATTSVISARQALPDSYYSLVHAGTLDWEVRERMLTLTGSPNALRNLAVMLPLSPQGVELGRCYCRYPIEIDIAADGTMNIVSTFPEFTLTPNALTLHGTFAGAADTGVTWDFGDGSALVQGRDVQHKYSQSGRYEVLTRLVRIGHLTEYRSAVYVSGNHTVSPPLIVLPRIAPATPIPASGPIDLTVTLVPAMIGIALDCAIGKGRAFAESGTLTLKGIERGTPGKSNRVVLDFFATRNLSARLYSKQRFLPDEVVSISRARISTNRTFAVDSDTETTTAPNPFTKHIFGDNPVNNIVSPSDRWTFELPVAENPWFRGVSSSDVAEFDGSELDDAVLSLEHLILSFG